MSILTEYKQAQVLSTFGDCCGRNDFQGALAAVESALGQSLDDPLLWWYRVYARDRLGLMESGPAELQHFIAVRPGPAGSVAELVPRRAERLLDRQTLFSATVATASGPVCALFLELLNCNQSMALCGRLIALNPASRDDYLERFVRNLNGLKQELVPILAAGLAAISSNPDQFVNLAQLVHLLQIYEDVLKAEFMAADQTQAEAAMAAGRYLAGVIENGLADFLARGKFMGLRAQPMYDGLRVLVEALRAGWSMEFIGPGLLSLESRPNGAQLASYAALSVPDKDYWINLACLPYAWQVLDKAYDRPPDLRILGPEELVPADKRYMDKIARQALSMGFRLLGYYDYKCVRSTATATQVTAVFLSPEGDLWVSAHSGHLEKTGGFMSLMVTLFELLKLTRMETVDAILTDGLHISTMRHVVKMKFDPPPNLRVKKAPFLSSLKKMVTLQRELAESSRAGKTGVGYHRPASINDIIDIEVRLAGLEKRYRRSLPQFVQEHELEKLVIPAHRKYIGKVRELIDNLTGLYNIKYPER